jgi:acyl carrier protein
VHSNNFPDSTFVTSINWETWQEVGMAAEALRQLTGNSESSQLPPQEVLHPLLDRCISRNEAQEIYVTNFRVSQHWVLHEHGILGQPTIPGTTYLEMVRAAVGPRARNKTIEIREAHFLTPLIVEDDEEKEVRLILKTQGEGIVFSVMSKVDLEGKTWQEHARGTVGILETEPPERIEIKAIEARCDNQIIMHPLEKPSLGRFRLQRRAIVRDSSSQSHPVTVESMIITEEDSEVQARSMEFGPRWQSLKWVKLGIQEGLALLELPEQFEADLQVYTLHPALLDFAAGFLRLFKSQGSYLPFSYKRLKIKKPLPRRVYSYVKFVDSSDITPRFEVTLIDTQGTILAQIEEFTVMKVEDIERLQTSSGSRTQSFSISADGSDLREGLATPATTLKQDLSEGLSSAEGIDVFQRILSTSLPRLVVSTRNLLERIKQSRAQNISQMAETLEKTTSQRPTHPRPHLMTPYAAPRNETEQKLADIWQEVLGLERVGVHDNFFDLGGDSLLVTQIQSKFQERFTTEMSVANLLQYPTIAELVQFLSEQETTKQPTFQHVYDRASRQKEAVKHRKQKIKKYRKR